jgi:MFS family permease
VLRDHTRIASQRTQYILQLVQVFFVGLTLGMTRTVVPAVAESDFGVPKGDLALIATFVVAFGVIKAAMNLLAGTLSEALGRRPVLIIGWLVALPIPWLIWSAPAPPHAGGWWWIVGATALLGVNQGLTWSMTLTSKLDITRPERRGLTNGLNEFSGYFAVAVAGIVTGYLSDRLGARLGLLAFGYAAILPALFMASVCIRETRESRDAHASGRAEARPSDTQSEGFRRRNMIVLCQCGLIEKFIDSAMWFVLPVYLTQRGIDLRHIGWVPGVYAATWGCGQILTGPLSDRIGRKPLIVGGMLLCALALALPPVMSGVVWWMICAALAGIGMAMLYPTLGAAVSDLASPDSRGRLLGTYRFWRDFGYAVGAALLAAASAAHWPLEWSFIAVACVVALSAMAVWIAGAETRPASSLLIGGRSTRKSL